VSAFALVGAGLTTCGCAAFFGAVVFLTRGFATGLAGTGADDVVCRAFEVERVDFGVADFFTGRVARGSGFRLGFSFFATVAFVPALATDLRDRVTDFAALRPDVAAGAEAFIRVNRQIPRPFCALKPPISFGRHGRAMVAEVTTSGNRPTAAPVLSMNRHKPNPPPTGSKQCGLSL
jgi:hypothetical protein